MLDYNTAIARRSSTSDMEIMQWTDIQLTRINLSAQKFWWLSEDVVQLETWSLSENSKPWGDPG